MKGILEQGPIDLAAIARRAIRSYAMGEIGQGDCNVITEKVEELSRFLTAIKEGEE